MRLLKRGDTDGRTKQAAVGVALGLNIKFIFIEVRDKLSFLL